MRQLGHLCRFKDITWPLERLVVESPSFESESESLNLESESMSSPQMSSSSPQKTELESTRVQVPSTAGLPLRVYLELPSFFVQPNDDSTRLMHAASVS
jgi:hypothetical protein